MEAYIDVQSRLADLTDEEWLQALLKSTHGPTSSRGITLPGFPSNDLQSLFVGSAGEHTIREAFNFYQIARGHASRYGMPLQRRSQILDFGCGWGRIARLFLRDTAQDGIYGVDAWPLALDVCKKTNPYCNFLPVGHYPPSVFRDGMFDLIYAYSVFSHLSEQVGLQWIREFQRILRPGGILLATTQGRSFIAYCQNLRGKPFESVWHEYLAKAFVDAEKAYADYDAGTFLYAPSGGGEALPPEVYGEALIPRAYAEQVWSRHLSFRDFVDDRNVLPQALIVMQKA